MIQYDVNTPILFLIFNRPSTTVRVFSQIKKLKPRKLYIAADGPRSPEEKALCEQVRDKVTAIDWDCSIITLFRNENIGCARAISEAISWFFEQEPEGIILEDDCLPADSFFGFCSAMLERYRNDERIGHINGSNYQNGLIRGDGSYYFSTLTHVWGWAGWRRVWKDYQLRPESFNLFEKTKYIETMPAHARFKDIWMHNFKLHCIGTANSWDFQYSYLNLINNRLSIIPNFNLITNIGCSDNPTHFIKDHPLADVPLSEIDRIIHPTFFMSDLEADLYTQTIEYRISTSKVANSFLFIKDKLINVVSEKDKENGMLIPKIIHQIYFDENGAQDRYSAISKSWKEKNPEWEYRLWDKKIAEQFLETEFPDMIPLYRSFPYEIQRYVFVRYLIVFQFGGLYVDLDYECIDPVDSLLWSSSCCMGIEPSTHAILYNKSFLISNSLIASVPKHDFIDLIIKDIASAKWKNNVNTWRHVEESIGSFMITRIYDTYPQKDEITLFPPDLVAPLSYLEFRELANGIEPRSAEEKIEKAFAVRYFV